MQTLLVLLLVLVLSPLARAQTGAVTKSTASATLNDLTADLNVPSGKTATVKSGGTLNASAGTLTLADAQLGWTKVNKTGSTLADLSTRLFADLQSKPTTLTGYGITDGQPLNANLTSLSALSTTQTANTFYAGPASGSAAAPAFRVIAQADIQAAGAPLRNALAPRGGLAFDGTANTRVTATLTNQNIGTDAFSVAVMVKVPLLTGTQHPILSLTSSQSTVTQAASIQMDYGTDGKLRVYVYGATTSDYFGSTFASATYGIGAYAGKTVLLTLARTSAGAIELRINGGADIWANRAADSGGSVPTAAQSITSTYLALGFGSASVSSTLTIYSASLYNLALSVADILEIYELGGAGAERFKFGSQVAISSGTLTVGKSYRITAVGGTFTGVGSADNAVGTTFTATGTTPTWGTGTVFRAGAVCHFDGENELGYQWHDQSTNKLDAVITTTGATWTKPQRRGYVRGTLTWAATHEAKSVLGQQAFPAEAVIARVTAKPTAASSGSGITIGSTTTAARWVAANAITTAKKNHTLANTLPAGSAANDLDLVVDPDTANYTGSIAVEAQYSVTEGTP